MSIMEFGAVIVILSLLALLGCCFWKCLKKQQNPVNLSSLDIKKLVDTAALIGEEIEARRRVEREEQMIAYTKLKMRQDPKGIRGHIRSEDKPVVNIRERVLIPFNLTESEKEILREFYGGD